MASPGSRPARDGLGLLSNLESAAAQLGALLSREASLEQAPPQPRTWKQSTGCWSWKRKTKKGVEEKVSPIEQSREESCQEALRDINENIAELRHVFEGLRDHGGYMGRTNTKNTMGRAGSQGSSSTSIVTFSSGDASSFPMMGMPMDLFLNLDTLKPYPVAEAEGLIEEIPVHIAVHFLSHQWLANKHADPKAVQLARIQRLFSDVRFGHSFDMFAPEDWVSFATGSANKTYASARKATQDAHGSALDLSASNDEGRPEELFKKIYAADMVDGYVWMDFFSIPQALPGMTVEELNVLEANQLLAINTIPHYVNRSSYFYVLAPLCQHEDGSACDFSTWRDRGWCRAEEMANFLAPSRTMMPIVVTEAPRVKFLEFFDMFLFRAIVPECSVFNGTFKCCSCNHSMEFEYGRSKTIPCDKLLLSKVIARMYEAKLDKLKEQGNNMMYCIYRCVEPALLAGSPDDRRPLCCSPDNTIADFPSRFLGQPADPQEAHPSGIWLIEWAAMLGHSSMISKLIKAGCSADVADNGGLTPLMQASLFSDKSAATTLLDEGGITSAGINRATLGMGITAIDRAAKGGHVKIAELLLSRRASLNVAREDGSTPLLSAVEVGHQKVCQFLLASAADVHATTNKREGALHLAARSFSAYGPSSKQRAVLASMLVQAGADSSLEDSLGQTALDIAINENNKDFVVRLMQAIASKQSALRVAAEEEGDMEAIVALVGPSLKPSHRASVRSLLDLPSSSSAPRVIVKV